MNKNKPYNPVIVDQAAEWAVLLDEGELSSADQQNFADWLLQGPGYIAEFLAATAILEGTSELDRGGDISIEDLLSDKAPEIIPFIGAQAEEQTPVGDAEPGRNVQWRKYAAAASIALLVLTASVIAFAPRPEPQQGSPDLAFVTERGEQRSFTLEDGSVIHLNTLSSLSTDFSSTFRNVYLRDGEAVFKVAHDPSRPFRVWTEDDLVQAVGTEFNVYRMADRTTVTVLEGSVAVLKNAPTDPLMLADLARPAPLDQTVEGGKPQQPLLVGAGQQAVLMKNEPVKTAAVADVEKAISWKSRSLIFRSENLSAVAREFNRYNRKQIMIQGERLAKLPISGVFSADDPDSLVEFLIQSGAATIERNVIGGIELREVS